MQLITPLTVITLGGIFILEISEAVQAVQKNIKGFSDVTSCRRLKLPPFRRIVIKVFGFIDRT